MTTDGLRSGRAVVWNFCPPQANVVSLAHHCCGTDNIETNEKIFKVRVSNKIVIINVGGRHGTYLRMI